MHSPHGARTPSSGSRRITQQVLAIFKFTTHRVRPNIADNPLIVIVAADQPIPIFRLPQTTIASEASFSHSGRRYRAMALRDVLCEGGRNHPEYRYEVDNGSIPLITTPGLRIFEGKRRLLDIELRIASSRDNRSFTRLLIDIASGENEREVPERLVAEKIRFIAKDLPRYKTEAMIGCTLGLIKCK